MILPFTLLCFDSTAFADEQFQKTSLEKVFEYEIRSSRYLTLQEILYFAIPPADIQYEDISVSDRKRQRIHLKFFQNALIGFKMAFWTDLRCLNIEYMPPTTLEIDIIDCHQEYQLYTRCLPKDLERLNLRVNRLFGPVDLQALPPKLIVLDLSGNAINGKIVLSNLPETIHTINLSRNRNLIASVVYYAYLPQSLKIVNLMFTSVLKVKPIKAVFDRNDVFLL
mmetsp:Transcript_24273/g.37834  ORF Transcript_24273/g.37834 Transcript_24273/m.37834 type:complete len:224 (-) Transcript_24273:11-682(-)